MRRIVGRSRHRHLEDAMTAVRVVMLCAAVLLQLVVSILAQSGGPERAAPAVTSRDWRRLQTPNLLVVGNARAEDLRRTAEEIERFRQAIRALSPNLPMDSPVPMVAVVFRDDHEVTPFKPRNRGKPVDNVAAYFAALPDINYIVLAPSDNREFTYRVIFHEYTHFLVNRSSRRLPMWLNEGLAEFYSTFNGSERDSRMIVGRPIPAHRMLLREAGGLIPLKKFLDSTALPALLRDPRSTQRFYAESWALTHYLLLGDARIHQPKLRAFIAAMQTGESSDRALAKAFGDNVEALHAGFLSYLNRATMPAVQLPQVT
jgi:Protein of unknown function (DUF1570)